MEKGEKKPEYDAPYRSYEQKRAVMTQQKATHCEGNVDFAKADKPFQFDAKGYLKRFGTYDRRTT